MKKTMMMAFSALVALAPLTAMAETHNITTGVTEKGVGLAAHGYDVVAFFTRGKPVLGQFKYTTVHDGAAYRFASAEDLAMFTANPQKYEPQFGGFCAYGVSQGGKADGNPNFWKIVDGKLYFNLSGEVQGTWLKDLQGNIAKGEQNWKTLANKT